jgi:hypothetical protein
MFSSGGADTESSFIQSPPRLADDLAAKHEQNRNACRIDAEDGLDLLAGDLDPDMAADEVMAAFLDRCRSKAPPRATRLHGIEHRAIVGALERLRTTQVKDVHKENGP